MKRISLLTIALLSTATISPASGFDLFKSTDNQESCIIDGLQGVNNKAAAIAINMNCRNKYPTYQQAKPMNPLGKMDDWESCMAKYGASTSNTHVAKMIRAACVRVNVELLPDFKPLPLNELCPNLKPYIVDPAKPGLFDDIGIEATKENIDRCRDAGYKVDIKPWQINWSR